MKTLVLSSSDIMKCYDPDALRKCMALALTTLARRNSTNYPRHVQNISAVQSIGFMLAESAKSKKIIGYKVVSVYSKKCKRALNPHQGVITLLEPTTGEVKAILEGSTLTAIRTAAVSAAATDLLSRKNSKVLAMIGSGRQAIEHVHALLKVRKFKKITIWSRTIYSANTLAKFITKNYKCETTIAPTPTEAIRKADVIVTCTSSSTPIFDVCEIPRGAHLNAIGACRPGAKEVAFSDHKGLRIFLDSRSSCYTEASEIINPLIKGELSENSIVGEIGDCFAKKVNGRTNAQEITVFKSVGLGIEDIFAAHYLVDSARALKVGTVVDLGGT